MAELKFKILGDLSQLKKDINKLLSEKFSIGSGGKGGTVKGNKEQKKQSSVLSGILAATSAILGVLSAAKPLRDLFKIGMNFIIYGILKVFKFLKMIDERFKELRKSLIEKLKAGWEFIKALPGKIWEFIKSLPGRIWEFIKSLPGLIWSLIKLGFDGLMFVLKTLWNLLKTVGNFLREGIKNLWTTIKSWLKNIWKILTNLSTWIWDKIKTGFNWIVDKVANVWNSIKELPVKIWNYMVGGFNMVKNAILELIRKIPFVGKRVGDAILRPDGSVVETDPRDTLIATQNPNGGVGGSKVFNFYGVTPQEMIDVMKRELGVDVTRSTRF